MGEITRLNLSWTLLFFGLFLGLFWGRSELLPTAAGVMSPWAPICRWDRC